MKKAFKYCFAVLVILCVCVVLMSASISYVLEMPFDIAYTLQLLLIEFFGALLIGVWVWVQERKYLNGD